MQEAIKITINGKSFLLPGEQNGFYEFPTYIQQHRAAIVEWVEASKHQVKDPLGDHMSGLPDMSEFKRITGIIGFPFSAHDPDLYALDRGWNVVMEVDIRKT